MRRMFCCVTVTSKSRGAPQKEAPCAGTLGIVLPCNDNTEALSGLQLGVIWFVAGMALRKQRKACV